MRLLLRLAALVLLLLVVYLAVTFVQVWQASRRDEAQPADAIVVFGAAQYQGRPSPVLRARLDHAVALYERRLAPVVWVTGGRRPGDRTTEASASAAYLVRAGIPDGVIRREVRGRSSWASLAAAARFLKRDGDTRVLLVSDGFHAARIAAMADELGLTAHTSPAPGSPISGGTELRHMARETVLVAVGRVVGFRRAAGVNERVGRVRDELQNGYRGQPPRSGVV